MFLQSCRGLEKKAFKPIMSSPSFGQLQGDGCYVLKGDILVKQRTMKDYPGLNVRITFSYCNKMSRIMRKPTFKVKSKLQISFAIVAS